MAKDAANDEKRYTHDGHSPRPAVVCTKSHEEVATVGIERITEVLGTSPDVVALEASHKI